jgi:hypothetical protein
LRNADRADIDQRTFTTYSMNPENPGNDGKWEAWQALGYDLGDGRADSAADVTRQLRSQLAESEPYEHRDTPYGPRCHTDATIVGPNGRVGTLVVVWQYDDRSVKPRMVTHWVGVHTEKGQR